MKFGKGIPVNDFSVSDEQRDSCESFNALLQKTGGHKGPGWYKAEISYHVSQDGSIDLIDETKIMSFGESGCGKQLAPGQWWGYCGETDMGQSAPALCTECGGEYKIMEPLALLKSDI